MIHNAFYVYFYAYRKNVENTMKEVGRDERGKEAK